jgi:hypothetical protein
MTTTTYKRTLVLGKVDYNGTGRADCPVELELELRYREAPIITKSANPEDIGKPAPFKTTDHREVLTYTELSICGSVWMPSRRDIYSVGQNIDEIAAMFPDNAPVQRIAEIWREWHLNGMTQGCIHQPERWTCTHLKSDHAANIQSITEQITAARLLPATEENVAHIARAEKRRAELVAAEAKAHDEPIVNGWPVVRELFGEHPYPHTGTSCHACGRARWDEPSDHCPETGYRYGTAWLVRELPPEVETEIKALFGN